LADELSQEQPDKVLSLIDSTPTLEEGMDLSSWVFLRILEARCWTKKEDEKKALEILQRARGEGEDGLRPASWIMVLLTLTEIFLKHAAAPKTALSQMQVLWQGLIGYLDVCRTPEGDADYFTMIQKIRRYKHRLIVQEKNAFESSFFFLLCQNRLKLMDKNLAFRIARENYLSYRQGIWFFGEDE
jgi:hypothetical protein